MKTTQQGRLPPLYPNGRPGNFWAVMYLNSLNGWLVDTSEMPRPLEPVTPAQQPQAAMMSLTPAVEEGTLSTGVWRDGLAWTDDLPIKDAP